MPATRPPSLLTKFVSELGIHSVLHAPLDTHLLLLARFTRFLAYGSSTLILALYLSALKISDARIGLFMTLTLLGDVGISLLVTLVADAWGRRKVLMVGAGLMGASGVVFAVSGNFWVLLVAGIVGVVSPRCVYIGGLGRLMECAEASSSGNEIGPFRAIEESTLAQLTPAENRSDIFAWYALFANAGTAIGSVAGGWIAERLMHPGGWSEVGAYRFIFGGYALLGLIKLVFCMMLSERCEIEGGKDVREYEEVVQLDDVDADAENLLSDDDEEFEERGSKPQSRITATPMKRRSIWPAISRESRSILLSLSLLFAVDSFASGLIPRSWITYFFNQKFHFPEGDLGTLFFVTNLISSISNLFASSLAKRIGLIQTMFFTHLPSSILAALIPLPSHVWLAMTFLILRSCLQNMDQAPRQAFLAAAVLPSERTAVMGVVNVVKTLAQSGGPVVTGWLAGMGKFWVAFLVAGALKAAYDLSMLWMFWGFRGREEMEGEGKLRGRVEREEGDEEEA
ncbi:hypothetical protein ACLMJK_002881 [Lecanora helva]